MRGTGGGSTSAVDVPERTNTGLRWAAKGDGSTGGGAIPLKV